MKKVILSILAILIILAFAFLFYLNEAVLPQKLKIILTESISAETGKTVSIGSCRLDIFKGLIINDFKISDDERVMISSARVRCSLLVMPVFKKEIVVTAMRLDSPEIFVQRYEEGSINIAQLFPQRPIKIFNGLFDLVLSRVVISHGVIIFKDDVVKPSFMYRLENAAVDLRFHFPGKIAFQADFQIPSEVPMAVKAEGAYLLAPAKLSARSEVRDFSLKIFAPYVDQTKFIIPEGKFDGTAAFDMDRKSFEGSADLSTAGMKFTDGKLVADINCAVKVKIKYDLASKELVYDGRADVGNLALSGIGNIGDIHDIRGVIEFSDHDMLFTDLSATILGIRMTGEAKMASSAEGVLQIELDGDCDLASLSGILKERFALSMPEIKGDSHLHLGLRCVRPYTGPPEASGYADLSGASLLSKYNENPLHDIYGKVSFNSNQLKWSRLEFEFLGDVYESSGTLTNFDKPGIRLELLSDRLNIRAVFAVNEDTVSISELAGTCRGYDFFLRGDIDMTNPKSHKADVTGKAMFEFSEDKEPFKSLKDKYKDAKPSGHLTADFTLKGDLENPLLADIDARISTSYLRLYGFTASDFDMELTQRNGIAVIGSVTSRVYGGTLRAEGKIDLVSKNNPYQLNAELKDVRLQDLKRDTPLKDTNISGTIRARFGIKSGSADLAGLSAWGNIGISNGNLWEINLFKGIGALLFKSDFYSVVFREGSCDFFVKDKTFFTNSLSLKSNLLHIFGTVRIGFDKELNAFLKAEFTDEGVDAASMTLVPGAIERYSIIEGKGSIDNPQFKIRPDLSNVVYDIADSVFNR